MKGLTIIYIGDGKGKTTAAVGLAVRAAGAGKRVLFCQFVKAAEARESGEWPLSSEIESLKKIENITVKVLGKGFVGILGDTKEKQEHVAAAQEGLAWLREQIENANYDVIIADELISAIEVELLELAEIADIIAFAKGKIQAFALTGHNKYNELLEAADLVSEMKMIKHPYYQGRLAERGIDY
jgi:cob(I)alamin adenosyltransferase